MTFGMLHITPPILAVRRTLPVPSGFLAAIPSLMLRLMMLHRHRTPMMLAIPPMHGLALLPFTFQVPMLIVPMFPHPALAIMVPNLFVPIKRLVGMIRIVITRRRANRCPQSHCQN